MSVLKRLARSQGRRDEVPNQELARDLVRRTDKDGIREIAEHLFDKSKDVQADCIKVLYEVGYLEPALVAPYAEDFIALLSRKNNRLVWGGMTALATVAALKPEVVLSHLPEIRRAMQAGSVITVDGGVLALARAASTSSRINAIIFPHLLAHLKTCRPKDVPQHSEKALAAVQPSNRAAFIKTLEQRMTDLSGVGLARVKKVIQQARAT
jgi:hypothetical protein